MTLYEMATGQLPTWGDGQSDPSMLDCAVTLDSELFDPAVRDGVASAVSTTFSTPVAMSVSSHLRIATMRRTETSDPLSVRLSPSYIDEES